MEFMKENHSDLIFKGDRISEKCLQSLTKAFKVYIFNITCNLCCLKKSALVLVCYMQFCFFSLIVEQFYHVMILNGYPTDDPIMYIIKIFTDFFNVHNIFSNEVNSANVLTASIAIISTIYLIFTLIFAMWMFISTLFDKKISLTEGRIWSFVTLVHDSIFCLPCYSFVLQALLSFTENRLVISGYIIHTSKYIVIIWVILLTFNIVFSLIINKFCFHQLKVSDMYATKTSNLSVSDLIFRFLMVPLVILYDGNAYAKSIAYMGAMMSTIYYISSLVILLKYLPFYSQKMTKLQCAWHALQADLSIITLMIHIFGQNLKFSVSDICFIVIFLFVIHYQWIRNYLKKQIINSIALPYSQIQSSHQIILKWLYIKKLMNKGSPDINPNKRISHEELLLQGLLNDHMYGEGKLLLKEHELEKIFIENYKEIGELQPKNYEQLSYCLRKLVLAIGLKKFPECKLLKLLMVQFTIYKSERYHEPIILLNELRITKGYGLDIENTILQLVNHMEIILKSRCFLLENEEDGTMLGANEIDILEVINSEKIYASFNNELVSQAGHYIEFWDEFTKAKPNMLRLSQLSYIIEADNKRTYKKLDYFISNHHMKYPRVYLMYGLFLMILRNQKGLSQRYLRPYFMNAKKLKDYRFKNTETMCKEYLFGVNNVTVIISLQSNQLGQIKSISHSIESYLDISADSLLGENLTTIMPPFFRLHHNKIIQNYLRTGEGSALTKHTSVFLFHKNKYLIPADVVVKYYPYIDEGAAVIGILRPYKIFREVILVDECGKLDSYSRKIGKLLNLPNQEMKKIKISEICPEFMQINKIVNVVARKKIKELQKANMICQEENNETNGNQRRTRKPIKNSSVVNLRAIIALSSPSRIIGIRRAHELDNQKGLSRKNELIFHINNNNNNSNSNDISSIGPNINLISRSNFGDLSTNIKYMDQIKYDQSNLMTSIAKNNYNMPSGYASDRQDEDYYAKFYDFISKDGVILEFKPYNDSKKCFGELKYHFKCEISYYLFQKKEYVKIIRIDLLENNNNTNDGDSDIHKSFISKNSSITPIKKIKHLNRPIILEEDVLQANLLDHIVKNDIDTRDITSSNIHLKKFSYLEGGQEEKEEEEDHEDRKGARRVLLKMDSFENEFPKACERTESHEEQDYEGVMIPSGDSMFKQHQQPLPLSQERESIGPPNAVDPEARLSHNKNPQAFLDLTLHKAKKREENIELSRLRLKNHEESSSNDVVKKIKLQISHKQLNDNDDDGHIMGKSNKNHETYLENQIEMRLAKTYNTKFTGFAYASFIILMISSGILLLTMSLYNINEIDLFQAREQILLASNTRIDSLIEIYKLIYELRIINRYGIPDDHWGMNDDILNLIMANRTKLAQTCPKLITSNNILIDSVSDIASLLADNFFISPLKIDHLDNNLNDNAYNDKDSSDKLSYTIFQNSFSLASFIGSKCLTISDGMLDNTTITMNTPAYNDHQILFLMNGLSEIMMNFDKTSILLSNNAEVQVEEAVAINKFYLSAISTLDIIAIAMLTINILYFKLERMKFFKILLRLDTTDLNKCSIIAKTFYHTLKKNMQDNDLISYYRKHTLEKYDSASKKSQNLKKISRIGDFSQLNIGLYVRLVLGTFINLVIMSTFFVIFWLIRGIYSNYQDQIAKINLPDLILRDYNLAITSVNAYIYSNKSFNSIYYQNDIISIDAYFQAEFSNSTRFLTKLMDSEGHVYQDFELYLTTNFCKDGNTLQKEFCTRNSAGQMGLIGLNNYMIFTLKNIVNRFKESTNGNNSASNSNTYDNDDAKYYLLNKDLIELKSLYELFMKKVYKAIDNSLKDMFFRDNKQLIDLLIILAICFELLLLILFVFSRLCVYKEVIKQGDYLKSILRLLPTNIILTCGLLKTYMLRAYGLNLNVIKP